MIAATLNLRKMTIAYSQSPGSSHSRHDFTTPCSPVSYSSGGGLHHDQQPVGRPKRGRKCAHGGKRDVFARTRDRSDRSLPSLNPRLAALPEQRKSCEVCLMIPSEHASSQRDRSRTYLTDNMFVQQIKVFRLLRMTIPDCVASMRIAGESSASPHHQR
jgi:hypothetical protein